MWARDSALVCLHVHAHAMPPHSPSVPHAYHRCRHAHASASHQNRCHCLAVCSWQQGQACCTGAGLTLDQAALAAGGSGSSGGVRHRRKAAGKCTSGGHHCSQPESLRQPCRQLGIRCRDGGSSLLSKTALLQLHSVLFNRRGERRRRSGAAWPRSSSPHTWHMPLMCWELQHGVRTLAR